MRELVLVGVLAAAGLSAQLLTHLHGALNCDATPRDIEEVLELVAGIGHDVSIARGVWARVQRSRTKPSL
jgi:alkylhydroperoxidase/carboxymuconolactone decarboxylase family protein YurZ